MLTLAIVLIVLLAIGFALIPIVGKLDAIVEVRYQKNVAAGKYADKDRLRMKRNAIERGKKNG